MPTKTPINFDVSEKTALAFDLFDDPRVVDGGYGGGAGGAKTVTITSWAVLQCRKYPGIRIGLGRNEIANIRKTTAVTLMGKTHKYLNVLEDDYVYHPMVDPGVYYRNGSAILFIDMAYAPSDPDFDRFGSLELTHVIIEEAGEVMKKARDVLISRKNRWLNDHYGITGMSISTCNPAPNFMRTEYYDPYLKLKAINGRDAYQVWYMVDDSGNPLYVNLPDGTRERARRVFIKSLVTDNPFADRNYIENLRSLPLAERKRLLYGDWDYFVDARTMFKRVNFIRSNRFTDDDPGYAGCDPSRGGDACTFAYIKGATLKELVKLPIPDGTRDKGTYVAQKFIEFCRARNIPPERAAIDAIGIGASVQDAGERLGFEFQLFNSGSTTGVRTLDDQRGEPTVREEASTRKKKKNPGIPLFDNIRSQNFYDMAAASDKGEITYSPELQHYEELCTELEQHGYETKDRQIIVDKKPGAKGIKAKLGHSPDLADCFQAAWWVKYRVAYSFQKKVSI